MPSLKILYLKQSAHNVLTYIIALNITSTYVTVYMVDDTYVYKMSCELVILLRLQVTHELIL